MSNRTVLMPLIERLVHPKWGGEEILGRLILPHLREIYEDLFAAVLAGGRVRAETLSRNRLSSC